MRLLLPFILLAAVTYFSFSIAGKKKKGDGKTAGSDSGNILKEFFGGSEKENSPKEDIPEKGITEDRLRHSLGVARRCREIAEENGLDKDACTRLFLLGLLHDVGYETADNRKHASEGSEMLDTISFPLSQEVLLHGQPIPLSKQSEELRILNRADIETLPDGTRCTPEERLRKAAEQYGQESEQYKNLEDLIRILGPH